jgi:hypothetical protein
MPAAGPRLRLLMAERRASNVGTGWAWCRLPWARAQVTKSVSVGLGDWMCSRGMRLRTTIRGWVSFIRVWCTAYGNNDVHYVGIVANYFYEGFGRALGWRTAHAYWMG